MFNTFTVRPCAIDTNANTEMSTSQGAVCFLMRQHSTVEKSTHKENHLTVSILSFKYSCIQDKYGTNIDIDIGICSGHFNISSN